MTLKADSQDIVRQSDVPQEVNNVDDPELWTSADILPAGADVGSVKTLGVLGSPPSLFDNYNDFYNENNLIAAGSNNEIVFSSRCTIINGCDNLIQGKYNTHIIGNYIGLSSAGTDIEDNSFNVGCYNGIKSWGPLRIERGDSHFNGNVFINSNNNLICEGDIVAFASSDKRLKTQIKKIDDCLIKIQSIRPIEFDWSTTQKTHKGRDIGLIAQEVQKIAPEIVTKREDGYLAMKYEKVVPLLVGAIQDQQKIINEMRAELDEIKSKINY